MLPPPVRDEAADGRGRYIAARNRQDSGLLHPGIGPGVNSDLVGHRHVDVESTQDVQLVLRRS